MAKLLLVEDDNNLREIYEARLQAEGYTIVSAKDGEEALVVAKTEKPDLVISDVMMPKISGFEMLDIMRNTEELKGVKVIMLTALGQSDDQQRADKLGADRYLVKSQVTLEDIVKTAHDLLGDQPEAEAGGGDAPAGTADAQTGDKPEPATPAEPDAAQAKAAEPASPPPAPTAEPAVKTAPDTEAIKDAAEPAAQEEADVEAKIEDFVAGATTEPTAPAGPSEPAKPSEPEPAATQPAPPAPAAPAAPDAGAQASDDKLMADAVETLVAASTDKPEPAAKATTIPVSVAPDDKPEPPAASAGDPPDSGEGGGGGKKIIKPLDSAPKKDIKELLAEEEAKEAQTIPGATISAVPAASARDEDKPAGDPMLPPSATAENSAGPEPTDPNSIAL